MPFTLIYCVLLLFVSLESSAVLSSSSEMQTITACRAAIRKAESVYCIPPRLLESIALIESGRSIGKAAYPWPWTVTVNGRGHYFPTKSAAIAAVKRFQARGARNIDVGCMQVNLFHHQRAFKSLQEAFDITQNVSYAAKFLKELQAQYASWSRAVGCYHSATPHLHGPYRHRVLKKWAEVRRCSAEYPVTLCRPHTVLASFMEHQSSHPSAKTTKSAKSTPPVSKPMHQVARRTGKPMSAFYASLNRRTSGKIYQANLCKSYVFPRYSYLLKVGS